MTTYRVDCLASPFGDLWTLVEAESPAQARDIAVDDFVGGGAFPVREATEEDRELNQLPILTRATVKAPEPAELETLDESDDDKDEDFAS